MDRDTWLQAMRHHCEAEYDQWALFYGEKWGLYSNITHQQFMHDFLGLLPPGSTLLDAACGAGRYLPFLLEQGHTVVAIDQSQGMLDNAQGKFPSVHFAKIGLQEMAYCAEFDGALCIDAIENVPPEDWSLVLGNFQRALKPKGYFYFTVETREMTDEHEIRQAYARAQEAGLPVVDGEWPDEVVYHYHPTQQQVSEWTQQAGFQILQEANGELWYYHILVQKIGDR